MGWLRKAGLKKKNLGTGKKCKKQADGNGKVAE